MYPFNASHLHLMLEQDVEALKAIPDVNRFLDDGNVIILLVSGAVEGKVRA